MSEKPKFGSKSSEDPNRRHFFRWGAEGPGVGTGKCMYCELRMKFAEKGPRGGRMRLYSKDGKTWGEKEFQCHVREHAVAAKEPTKKNGTKKAAKKNGTKRAATGAKKAVANKSPHKTATKKRAAKKPAAPAPEVTAPAE
jgi:hypothetical protein